MDRSERRVFGLLLDAFGDGCEVMDETVELGRVVVLPKAVKGPKAPTRKQRVAVMNASVGSLL